MRIEIPATADRLSEVRRRLQAWLEEAGVPDAIAADIVLAANEACSNCIEHAYRDRPGVIQIEAAEDDGRIVLSVADFGVWRPPTTEPTTRGRGLPIMEALSNGVELTHTAKGTTVRMCFELAGQELQEWGSRTT